MQIMRKLCPSLAPPCSPAHPPHILPPGTLLLNAQDQRLQIINEPFLPKSSVTIAQPVSDVIPAFDELRTSTGRGGDEKMGEEREGGGKREGREGPVSAKLRGKGSVPATLDPSRRECVWIIRPEREM